MENTSKCAKTNVGSTLHELNRKTFFQPSLTIGLTDDVYEREADAVADTVMRMGDTDSIQMKISPITLQRKCAACSEEEKGIQRKEINHVIQRDGDATATQPVFTPKYVLPTPSFLNPPTGPDFLALRQPFIDRNIFHLWDPGSALQVWNYNFDFFRRFGLTPSLSITLSNLTAPRFIDSQLKTANPLWWEITDRELNTTTYNLSLPLIDFYPDFTPTAPSWLKTIFGGGGNSVQKKSNNTITEVDHVQRKEQEASSSIDEVIQSSGNAMADDSRAFMESRFGYDFSQVKIHTNTLAAKSAQSINALAYTTGNNVVFNTGQYAPSTDTGKKLLAHELTHVVQQVGGQSKKVQRREAPYIKKVTVHLTPPQTADLEWEGTPPTEASGSDHFTVSTGKGYSNPGDDAGTCTRSCCTDALTQCAAPWNKVSQVGSCCTYIGDSYWTGKPEAEHGGAGGWKWWTPIQPNYGTRGIALHQHPEVTGQPIGHGCVRMDEANAKRIYDFSNRDKTNVTIEGNASPVECKEERKCTPTKKTGQLDTPFPTDYLGQVGGWQQEANEGWEDVFS